MLPTSRFLDEEEPPWEEEGDDDKMAKTSSIGARKHSGIRDNGSKCKFLRGWWSLMSMNSMNQCSPFRAEAVGAMTSRYT